MEKPYARPHNQGLIMTVLIIIVALIVLKFVFDIDIIKFLNSGWVQKAFGYIQDVFLTIWNNFLKTPVTFLWEKFRELVK